MRSLAMLTGLMLVPCALSAQRTGVAAAGRVAGIAAPVVRAERIVAPPPGSFLIGGVPVVVLSDGRMFADFGYGYEPITRGCGGGALFVQSAAIPAQSPTLSPTKSAITPAFLGSSSGRPFSTFPTKSAPTSAALV